MLVLAFVKARRNMRLYIVQLRKEVTRYYYSNPDDKPRHLAEVVEGLCRPKYIRLPSICVVEKTDNGQSRTFTALLDRLFVPDVLMVGRATLEALSPEALKVCMAHELAHSDALENKLVGLLRVLKDWLVLLLFAGGGVYLLLQLNESIGEILRPFSRW